MTSPILPGPPPWSGPTQRIIRPLALVALLVGLLPPVTADRGGGARGQGLPDVATDGDALPTDSTDLRELAEEIQASFELYRESRIPPALARMGSCDERIGRFCLSHGGDDRPVPAEPPEVTLARNRTLTRLGEVAERIPGDGWVLAQRVYYTTESGNLVGAANLVRNPCPIPDRWWCDALLGYVLEAGGRTLPADSAFRSALAGMPDGVREWYTTPEFILDGDGRELFEDAETGEREELWDRLWLLSDPLYLVEGNDRKVAHLARKTLVRIRSGSTSPYGIPFDGDRDLEELNVRYGQEVGYERVQGLPTAGNLRDTRSIVGRHPSDDREYLPTSDFLADPAEIPPGAWTLDEAEPRSGHTARYAPDMSPLRAQVARFRRGDSLHVVASYVAAAPAPLPEAGSPPGRRGGSEPEPRDDGPVNPFLGPDPEPEPDPAFDSGVGPDGAAGAGGGPVGGPEGTVTSGFFLLDWDGTTVVDTRDDAPAEVRTATVPDGEYVLGIEVHEEEAGRAWRLRQGIRQETLALGQNGISDLIFLRDGEGLPESLDEALPDVLPEIRMEAGGSFTVAWEVYGLRPGEVASVTLGFTEGEPSLLQRIGEFLRVVEPDAPVEIRFDDQAPDRLGTVFRALDVDVPSFEPGVYTLQLVVELPGRTPMVTSRRLVLD